MFKIKHNFILIILNYKIYMSEVKKEFEQIFQDIIGNPFHHNPPQQ